MWIHALNWIKLSSALNLPTLQVALFEWAHKDHFWTVQLNG